MESYSLSPVARGIQTDSLKDSSTVAFTFVHFDNTAHIYSGFL